MGGSLKEKILELRSLTQEINPAELFDAEKRKHLEMDIQRDQLQMYRNKIHQLGQDAYAVVRHEARKQLDCDFLSQIKDNDVVKKVREEMHHTDKRLASTLTKMNEEAANTFKLRQRLRSTEPELRNLADVLNKRIHGIMVATQIETKKLQKLKDLQSEFELEKEMINADQLALQREQEDQAKKIMNRREEIRNFINQQNTGSTAKAQSEEAEKEETHRLIQKLVDEENKKIAAEQAEKQRQREALKREYQKFFELHREIKQSQTLENRAHEEKLSRERDMFYEKREQSERRQKALIQARIQLQERVGAYTNELTKADERRKLAYLEASEEIAKAEAALAEYDMGAMDAKKKFMSAERLRQEMIRTQELRRKAKEENLELERQLEKRNLEAIMKETADREARRLADRKKMQESMLDHLERRKQMINEETLRNKLEHEALQKQHEEYATKVEAEKKVMLSEYEDYIRKFIKCNKKNEQDE